MKHTKWTKWKTQSLSNKVFDIVNYTLIFLFFIICLYPLYYVVIISFSSEIVGTVLWPKGFNVEAYRMVFGNKDVWTGYANTIINTVLSVVCGLCVTLPCAYAISRKDFVGRQIFLTIILITMYISGGMVPGYLNIYNLGLMDTRWAVILSSLCTATHIIIARTFFASSIPGELFDAAKIDGCGNGRYFTKVVLPLSKPIIAVIALYIGVARWNSYFSEMIYFRDKALSPLTLVLRRLLWSVKEMQALMDEGLLEVSDAMEGMRIATSMQYCLIVVSTLPMMLIYPYLQKYFAKGVMIGSVKG